MIGACLELEEVELGDYRDAPGLLLRKRERSRLWCLAVQRRQYSHGGRRRRWPGERWMNRSAPHRHPRLAVLVIMHDGRVSDDRHSAIEAELHSRFLEDRFLTSDRDE